MKRFYKYFRISRRSLGVILVEFAFAIPIFMILIYYLHDLPKMRLMQRKMQFIAYEMASILQNIAEQKKGSPVTGQDFISAMRIAYLSIYFGNTMNDSKSPHEAFKLGHHPYVGIYFIRGLGNDNIKIVWSRRCHGGNKNLFAEGENNATRCSVNMSATTATAFHPALIIK